MIDISEYLIKGKILEHKLTSNLKSAIAGTKMEDFKGIDLKININFDVKGAKKIRRRDANVSYDKTWLEYRNIMGNFGSLMKKDLDYFIFEREDFWDVRSRNSTLDFFTKMSWVHNGGFKTLKILNKNSEVELYEVYQREGRKDVIMLVEFDHPLWQSEFKIPKNLIS